MPVERREFQRVARGFPAPLVLECSHRILLGIRVSRSPLINRLPHSIQINCPNRIDQRLDQCVTLIRSGKKFAALELAEESPNALDLMERLSFAGDAKWKELCEEKSIYLGPNFTDDHVDMLEGLYGEKISEDHPVFREYRTAMRSRDEQRTFKILKTILRMNPDHEAAQRHFGQLSVKILEQRCIPSQNQILTDSDSE